jgi:hypothetical protein
MILAAKNQVFQIHVPAQRCQFGPTSHRIRQIRRRSHEATVRIYAYAVKNKSRTLLSRS